MRTPGTVLFLLAVWIANADTVTTRDSSSWNGKVTISGGVLSLVTTFPSGPSTLRFGSDYVRSIDFNATFYNPGADPKNLLPKPGVRPFSGTVYLRNKTNQACKIITVNAGNVLCDNKPVTGAIRIAVDTVP